MAADTLTHRPGSMAVVQRVRPGFETLYRLWSREINTACAQFPGFVDLEVFEPASGDDGYVIMIRFQTDAEGQAWQNSQICADLLKAAEPFLDSVSMHEPSRIFGGWFNSGAAGGGRPELWKDSLVVLFVLYPTVMLISLYITPHIPVPFAVSIFLGNVISIVLMSWLVMPKVTGMLSFWLTPPRDAGISNTLKGLAITLGGSLLMVAGFLALTAH